MIIGIDDTDSLKGMCTTYLTTLINKKLTLSSTPHLIRLNPNIPYKTRGNGAIAFTTKDNKKTKDTILSIVKKHSQLKDPKTNPGVVFLEDETKNKTLNEFYKKTVSEHTTIQEARKAAEKAGAEIHEFKNGRGVIGALAAVGAVLPDSTYELIAYRSKRNHGKKRKISAKEVFNMNDLLYPQVFDSIDDEKKQILIAPRGYDPIYCGIRGESKEAVSKAWEMLTPREKIEDIQIYKTNQATDAHLREKKISEVRPYDCVVLTGLVSKKPETIEGGHAIFALSDDTGDLECAAYRQTGKLRDVVKELSCGDEVTVYGGLSKYAKTVNLEKIKITHLSDEIQFIKPICCGRRMSSAGKNKGLKCKKCGKKMKEDTLTKEPKPRDLSTGFYEAPPRARRHLSRPLIRSNFS